MAHSVSWVASLADELENPSVEIAIAPVFFRFHGFAIGLGVRVEEIVKISPVIFMDLAFVWFLLPATRLASVRRAIDRACPVRKGENH